jgi:DNA helicase HerA-like ATPase
MSTPNPTVGVVTKPGKGANEFCFIAPADDAPKTNEFIAYDRAPDEPPVIGRVIDREENQRLQDTYITDLEVDPTALIESLGIDASGVEKYTVTGRVIGQFDEDYGSFLNPREIPSPGTKVRTAPDDLLERRLADLPDEIATDYDEEGAAVADIGRLLNRGSDGPRVRIPINEVAGTHLSVLAATGAGKSYTASVIVEEMMRSGSRASVLIFDPHAEYHTLTELRATDFGGIFDGRDGYRPTVNVIENDDVSLRISDLSNGDIRAILQDLSPKMRNTINSAWNEIRNGDSKAIGKSEIMTAVKDQDPGDSTIEALEWRLDAALSGDLLKKEQTIALDELASPGQVTVLQLNQMGRRNQQIVASTLLRQIYKERKKARRGDRDESDVPYPVFALLEEAHRFAPSESALSLPIIQDIMGEGRKFGFGLGVLSQRPSKVDPDVLSQCGTQVVMQMMNPTDQKAIEQSIEGAGEDVLAELPGLSPGEAVIAGDSMNTPVLASIRERYTTHGAETPDATETWRDASHEQQAQPDDTAPASLGDDDTGSGRTPGDFGEGI